MRSKRAVVTVLTIVLAMVTALTLVGTAATLADTSATTDASADKIAVVRSFYAAVNGVIATGDLSGLAALVAPTLTVGGPSGATGEGLETLQDHLLALHATRPGVWIRVEEAIAGGDLVVTRLAFDGLSGDIQSGAGLLAVPAPGSPAWAAGDRLRVVDGRVVAFEGITLALSPPRPALDQVIAAPDLGQARLGLARLTVAPGATVAASAATGPAAYVVERGTVDVRLTDLSGAGRVEQQLGDGGQLAVPAGFGITFHNSAPEPVVLLTAALTVPAAPWPPRLVVPGADSAAILPPSLVSVHAVVTPQPAISEIPTAARVVETVSLGTAAIAPGRLGLTGAIRLSLSWLTPSAERNVLTLPAAGPALLAVDTGQALVTSASGPSDLVAPEGSAAGAPSSSGAAPTIVLAAGQAALTEPGATVAIQTAGDHAPTLLLLTLAAA